MIKLFALSRQQKPVDQELASNPADNAEAQPEPSDPTEDMVHEAEYANTNGADEE